MMKRIDTPKRKFTFTVGGNPKVLTDDDVDQYSHMIPVYENWLEAEKEYERDWRNYELSNTDWMLVPDATYGGLPLAGSQTLQDIVEYRTALRDYNLTTEDRPTRPDWFK
ncbi:conserved hypothetical protein [Vibrio phage 168E36-1]|nr:conserved hypothetical protein [Vibrio phage 168E36-1]